MKKLIKILGIMVVSIVLLLVVAVVAISLLVDPNEYRDTISQQVKEQTGRDLVIKGDLSLSFFPWVGLNLGETTLSNAKGFGKEDFARFKQIGIKVKLMPLLSSQLEMDTIVIDGARINLAKNKQGKTNWDDFIKAGEKAEKQAESDDKGQAMKSVSIGGIEINDAYLSWRDDQQGSSYVLEKFNLTTGALQDDKPVKFKLGFTVQDKKANKAWPFALAGLLKQDREKQSLTLSGMTLELANLVLKGDIGITQMLTNPSINASLKSDAFVPRDTFTAFGIEPPKTADASVFGKAAMEIKLQANAAKLSIKQLELRLDDTTLKGTASVSNFTRPAIRYSLEVDEIDVDRYLPPPAEQPQKKTAQASSDALGLPIDMLRKLDVKGDFKVGKLKVSNLRSEQVAATLTAKKGFINVHPASAKMYGGAYKGNMQLDVRGKKPVIAMNERLLGIQASPLFKDLMDMDWISGNANLTAKLRGTGNTVTAIRSSLGGNIAFAFRDGSIKGVNIPLKIRQAYATIKGTPQPPNEPEKTDFSSMTGSAIVKKGVVDNRDLKILSPLLRIGGAGTVDLAAEKMDYLIKSSVVATLKGQEGDALEKLKGVTIPVRIKGPFTKLSYKVELDSILKQQAKKKAKKKIKKKLEEKLGDKLKGFF